MPLPARVPKKFFMIFGAPPHRMRRVNISLRTLGLIWCSSSQRVLSRKRHSKNGTSSNQATFMDSQPIFLPIFLSDQSESGVVVLSHFALEFFLATGFYRPSLADLDFSTRLVASVREQILSTIALIFKRGWIDERDGGVSRKSFFERISQLLGLEQPGVR